MKIHLFLTVILSFILLAQPCALAKDYMPKYEKSITNQGIGVLYAEKTFNVYKKPHLSSEITDRIRWGSNGVIAKGKLVKPFFVFIAFKPQEKKALLAVKDEIEGWCEVYINSKSGESGWVKKSENTKFYSWYKFINKIGRKNGLYFWADLPKDKKRLFISPEEPSEPVPDCYYPKHLQLKLIRGNWMLVKIIDYTNSSNVGWLKWRDEEGKILVFPKI